ncbi:ubiquitin-associated and SH3 domain-containing protein B-like [Antedon mediterranea]|uniref:ubiquitin-associated and SH3 domain-containing protein B-like n=1 Tax=Antedon mediterranea TaxID=105859 RepID=UPI003AF8D2FB
MTESTTDKKHAPLLRSSTIKSSTNNLELLMSMGFPKHRVEKSLASTGNQGVQQASDWLLNHLEDSTLDEHTAREFIMYACPVGPFAEELETFWDKSLIEVGRNGAHSLLPHVTLCSFFTCDDSLVAQVTHAFQLAIDRWKNEAPDQIAVEYFAAANFIGLFIEEENAEYMRRVAQDFSVEALNIAGIKLEPHKKQLHLTLAYQFHQSHLEKLEQLTKEINVNKSARWELRLYSRDVRAGKGDVYRVLYTRAAKTEEELEATNDDFVYRDQNDETSTPDWIYGVSHKTGCSGIFPLDYLESCPESDVWTLHRAFPITKTTSELIPVPPIRPPAPAMGSDEMHSSKYRNSVGLLQGNPEYENITINNPKKTDPRQLFVARHAERVDITFGQQWIRLSFDDKGKYVRKNINMPRKVPDRAGSPQTFMHDSPITEMGLFQARMTGEAMRDAGIQIKYIFSSPALRSVQTADAILKGLGTPSSVMINIDITLFEWLAWAKAGLPKWMTPEELKAFGLNVDTNYKSFITPQQLNLQENCHSYFKRSELFMRHILKHNKDGGNFLIVGHAGSLDGCTRLLQGLSPRPALEFTKIVQKVPYCGVIALKEYKEMLVWDMFPPPFPTLTHGPNPRFDWRIMQPE